MAGRQHTLQVAQDGEVPVQVQEHGPFPYRYAYARATETRHANQPGQDYLALREDEWAVVFALCDGVGESFYGDLAARFLGDALMEWLWNEAPAGFDEDRLRATLTARLREWTGPASTRVQKQPLPADSPALQRQALEEKRVLGSQSTFVCGRIDLPEPASPAGRVLLAWMGDSRARLWGPDGERSAELGGIFVPAQRWSSTRGPLGGEPQVFTLPLRGDGQALTTLAAYSDGLAGLDSLAQLPVDAALQEMIERAGDAATSDDVSFLQIWLPALPTQPDWVALPAPQQLQVVLDGGRLRVTWQAVPGASGYEVKLPGNRTHIERTEQSTWLSPELAPGPYRVQVRAWQAERPGPWSVPQRISIPQPVVAAPPAAPVPVKPLPVRPSASKEVAPAPVMRQVAVALLALAMCALSSVCAVALIRRLPALMRPRATPTAGAITCTVCVEPKLTGASISIYPEGQEKAIAVGQTGPDGCVPFRFPATYRRIIVRLECPSGKWRIGFASLAAGLDDAVIQFRTDCP